MSADDWIDATARVPPAGERVLVVVDKRVVTIAVFDESLGWRWTPALGTLRHQQIITHWRPLPPLPQDSA